MRFQSTKPRRSYKDKDQTVVKVDVMSMVNDANRATELEFAKHKARLKAQIMKDMVDDEEDGDRVTYVRLPGTSQVAEVAFYDCEDQIMERNLTAVDSKRVIDKGVFRCMVQPVILRKKIKFLMDTGCGHDLISKKKIERHDLETLVTPEPISFQLQTASQIQIWYLTFKPIPSRNRSTPMCSVTHHQCCQLANDA